MTFYYRSRDIWRNIHIDMSLKTFLFRTQGTSNRKDPLKTQNSKEQGNYK